jgi:hypothetical protein
MKTRFSEHVRLFLILCWAVLASHGASAQTTPELNLQLYAGLSITGAVGTVYSVEYVTDLAQTNSWRCLEFLQPQANPYLWVDTSAPATARRFYRAAVFAAPTNLVFIPPGTFRMGSPTNEVDREPIPGIVEGPQTVVTISKGFWMGKYLVTQGEYLAMIGTNPSLFNGDRNGDPPPFNQNYGTNLTVRWKRSVGSTRRTTAASSRRASAWQAAFRPIACIGCRQRRSGSTRAGRGPRRGSAMGMTRAIAI